MRRRRLHVERNRPQMPDYILPHSKGNRQRQVIVRRRRLHDGRHGRRLRNRPLLLLRRQQLRQRNRHDGRRRHELRHPCKQQFRRNDLPSRQPLRRRLAAERIAAACGFAHPRQCVHLCAGTLCQGRNGRPLPCLRQHRQATWKQQYRRTWRSRPGDVGRHRAQLPLRRQRQRHLYRQQIPPAARSS